MSFKHLHALCAVVVIALLAGCHSKIDLENIDKHAEVEMGVALPVGSIHATLGDFIGGGEVSRITVDEDKCFHFIDTVTIPTKDYHKIDVSKYILENKKPLKFGVKEKVSTSTIQAGKNYTLTFDLTLKTDNFQESESTERIDSVLVSNASFVSIINVEDFDLKWSEIQKVELELGSQFRRPGGKIIEIPVSGQGYNKEIPIDVRDFALDMMDHKKGGTIDQIKFRINFYVKPSRNISVSDDSQFSYDLKVKVINYNAIWGFFQAGNEMRDSQKLDMDSLWDGWKDIKKLKVRFMEPSIEAFLTHHIAAPLRMYIDYITAIDSVGNKASAVWDGETKTDFALKGVINPYDSPLDASVTNSQRFSSDKKEGEINKLFDVRPDYFSYSFYLWVDQNPRTDYPKSWQHRLTRDVAVTGKAAIDVPFKVDAGSEMEYTTTLSGIDISSISLDSILNEVPVIDSLKATEIKLIMEVENRIPFKIEGKFTFLNKDSVEMKMELIQDNTDNHILFPAPKMSRGAGEKYGRIDEPSVTRLIVSVDKNDFDKLSQVGYIRMDAALVDNPEPCWITTETDLRVRVGLAAQVDALLNFDREENKDNNNK